MLNDCIEKYLGACLRLLRLREFLVQIIDGGVLALERFSGGVKLHHQSAQFTGGIWRSDAYAQISGTKLLGHLGNAADWALDTDFRQRPYAGEEQQKNHADDGEGFIETFIGGRDQPVFGYSHHDIKPCVSMRAY